MKIKENLILKSIAGNHIVVPVGAENLDFKGMITLNDTGAFLWNRLIQECTEEELVQSLLAEYEVDESTAREGVAAFIQKLQEADFLA